MTDEVALQLKRLLEVMTALRTPDTGCPWDLEQTFESIAPYTIEEAYEVADAIARGDMADLEDELGDLLLQVVYHARIAEEDGAFSFADVTRGITEKMIRRHPHVFSDAIVHDPAEMTVRWDEIKAEERRFKARRKSGAPDAPHAPTRALDGVALALPALTRALKLQKKAARVGFDWDDPRAVIAKIREEIDEVEEALNAHGEDAVREEIGDLLFVIANLARHLETDPEEALKAANTKFIRRFTHIEDGLSATGRTLEDASLDEMEALWVAAKQAEKKAAT
ncbi:MAG: nucleoside triphosphate pyrophosphohydrolase [Pseudomonadota bacterium]